MLIEFIKIIDIRIFSPTNLVNFFKLDSISIRDATRDVSYSVKIPDKKKKKKEDRKKHLSIGNNSPVLPYLQLFKKRCSPSIHEIRPIRIVFKRNYAPRTVKAL